MTVNIPRTAFLSNDPEQLSWTKGVSPIVTDDTIHSRVAGFVNDTVTKMTLSRTLILDEVIKSKSDALCISSLPEMTCKR